MPKSLSHRASQVKDLALSATAKNSAILFVGNFMNAVLAMVVVIFASRALGPANFGILAVYNAVNTTIVGLTNFGLDTAAIKLISTYLEKNRHRAAVIMKGVFYLEIACGLLIIAAGAIFAPMLAQALGGEHLTLPVQLAFVASAFGSAAAFIGPFFVAYQRFTANALVGLIGGVLRLALILVLVATVGLNLTNTLWAYTLVPIVFFFAGLALAPKDWRIKTTRAEDRSAYLEIFHFSKWILLSYFATVLTGRLDVFLISRFHGSTQTGLYAAAIQLCSVMPILIGAVSTVLLPQVSRYTKRAEFMSYLKKVTFGALVICIVLAPVLIFGQEIIQLIFGDKYNGSFDAFRIMFLGYMVALFANPISLVLYGLNKPAKLTIVNYLQLVIAVAMNLVLIPTLGINGAALAFLIVNAFGGLASVLLAIRTAREVPA
jgi:O-antigen/teichoic acid export membrane protein